MSGDYSLVVVEGDKAIAWSICPATMPVRNIAKKQAEARQYDDEQDENCQGGENHGSRAGECADKPDADEVRRGSKQSTAAHSRRAALFFSCLVCLTVPGRTLFSWARAGSFAYATTFNGTWVR
jgi:hypothetical protein